MAKTIRLEYDGTTYTLEFTRRSVRRMEEQGFRVQDVTDRPMSTLPALFQGAFLAHHPFIKPAVVDAIFDRIQHKEDFLMKLAEMYTEPLTALMGEPEESEGDEKNVASWEANW